ncbi:DASS family sodium-coupled anion symporter [Sporomusa acidovorans]|uniref:Inner membrane protein YbhI n=1 Tax=Sporomusa acidovorans (strain ATCC 49682 / DSM 3132 / Mol) TaxID=1123286 RepID=A0ABZ3IXZ0_SPOA4|nr:DASS family sodium-coupled anion symporter [Sporomusa acidovorans]OZC15844.1 inner membrane protein YbhI [Sporomusa acidovorans DSM 3132]SDF29666.1 divalent anion:Na+ symporter, DASS family [Sporomusa acidovorans]
MKLLRGAVCIGIPCIILLFPVPAGLTQLAWQLFAIYLGAVLGIVLKPVAEPVVLLTALAVVAICFKHIHIALGAFGETTPWLVFTAFIIGQCFVETGLGKRIAYFLIDQFGKSSLRLGYISTVTDLILSPAIPSNTARTGGLVYPIFQSLAITLDSRPDCNPRRIGAFLMVLLYQNSLITGTMFITAGAIMPMMIKLTNTIMHADISWIDWALAMSVPGAICLLLVPYLVYRIFPPELTAVNSKAIAEAGYKELGPMSRREKILSVLFVLAVIGWATGTITKIESTTVALSLLSLSLLTGVISWEKVLACRNAWSTFIWYGGIISLANGLNHTKFFVWLGDVLEQHLHFAGMNSLGLLAGLLVMSVVVRYFFASTIAYVITFIPVIFTTGAAANLPALPLLLLCAASAQIASLMTHYGNAVGTVLFGAGYVDQETWWKIGHIVTAVSLTIYFVVGLSWWKILGLW